jgi:hypothetical protein
LQTNFGRRIFNKILGKRNWKRLVRTRLHLGIGSGVVCSDNAGRWLLSFQVLVCYSSLAEKCGKLSHWSL